MVFLNCRGKLCPHEPQEQHPHHGTAENLALKLDLSKPNFVEQNTAVVKNKGFDSVWLCKPPAWLLCASEHPSGSQTEVGTYPPAREVLLPHRALRGVRQTRHLPRLSPFDGLSSHRVTGRKNTLQHQVSVLQVCVCLNMQPLFCNAFIFPIQDLKN